MIRTYSQMYRTEKDSQHSSIIWLVWLNGWKFKYKLSGCGFESCWCHLLLRFYWYFLLFWDPKVIRKFKNAFNIAQKMKFCIKDFFIKCDQIRSFLQICSYLLKKPFMENLIFCVVYQSLYFLKCNWYQPILLFSLNTSCKIFKELKKILSVKKYHFSIEK